MKYKNLGKNFFVSDNEKYVSRIVVVFFHQHFEVYCYELCCNELQYILKGKIEIINNIVTPEVYDTKCNCFNFLALDDENLKDLLLEKIKSIKSIISYIYYREYLKQGENYEI